MAEEEPTITIPPSAPAPSVETAKEAKEKGNEAFRKENWAEAIQYYTQALEGDPTNHVYYSNRSAAYLKAQDFTSALHDAEQCIALQPAYHKGYGRQGAAYHAMGKYAEAVQAYQAGLQACPDEEHLLKGLAAAKRAALASQPASRSARSSRATRRASQQRRQQASQAPTVSAFVQQTRKELQLQMIAIQAQLQLINELAKMSDAEKLDLLFSLIDQDGDGTVDAKELAAALRKRHGDLTIRDSLERAMDMVAVFDADGDAKLDQNEFQQLIQVMMQELQVDFHEFSEFLVLQILLNEDPTSRSSSKEVPPTEEINEIVKEREQLFNMLVDPRLVDIFKLFDKDGSRVLTFKEVAVGLYQLTQNMHESAKATMNLLLMMDQDDQRTLNYEQFGRLIMAITAAAGSTFDEIADELMILLTTNQTIGQEDLAELLVADAVYEAAKDLQQEARDEEELVDALTYGRLQRLFDLWDVNHDGGISLSELSAGLRRFQAAVGMPDHAEEEARALVGIYQQADGEDQEHMLGPVEFAKAMIHYAHARRVNLQELIDFICVTTVLSSNEAINQDFQAAYGRALSGEQVPVVYPVHLEYYEGEGEEFYFM